MNTNVNFGDWMEAKDVSESEPQRVADCYNNTVARLQDALETIRILEKKAQERDEIYDRYLEVSKAKAVVEGMLMNQTNKRIESDKTIELLSSERTKEANKNVELVGKMYLLNIENGRLKTFHEMAIQWLPMVVMVIISMKRNALTHRQKEGMMIIIQDTIEMVLSTRLDNGGVADIPF
jgi:hypothetical protein